MSDATIGITLTMVAGLMSGNCMLPMKFAHRWKWENLWLVFSVVSLLVLPWGLAFAFVGRLLDVYQLVPFGAIAVTLLLGAGWGIAQILFGISVRRLGLGIGYAIIVGLGAVLGTLVPLLLGQKRFVSHDKLLEVLAGVVMMVVGIAMTAWGGQIRETAGLLPLHSKKRDGYVVAILLAVLCGFMAPMLNFAFAFGQRLAITAVQLGNTPVVAAYAVWPVALLGGLVPNLMYCFYLLRRNNSWGMFLAGGRDGFLAALMAALWMGAFGLYGMSSVYLGVLGTSIGWGLFQIFMIATATMSGLLTAEWTTAPRRALALLAAGMTGLIGATLLLASGGR